jgi:hypothetical protein
MPILIKSEAESDYQHYVFQAAFSSIGWLIAEMRPVFGIYRLSQKQRSVASPDSDVQGGSLVFKQWTDHLDMTLTSREYRTTR